MMPQIIEGVWEEVKTHESKLAGRYVTLIIEPEKNEIDSDTFAQPIDVRDQAHLEELLPAGLHSPRQDVTAETFDEIRVEVRRHIA